MKKAILFLIMALLLPLCAHAQENMDMAELDNYLHENQGKVILINFFATWCPPCRVEIPELVKLRKLYPADKLAIIGLAVDEDTSKVGPFVKKLGVNYPVYIASRNITDAYSISSVPHNAFYARNGELVVSEPGMAELSVLKMAVDDLLQSK